MFAFRSSLHSVPRVTAVVAVLLGAWSARAEDKGLPPEMQGIQIVEKPGAQLPLDLPFTNQQGKAVTLRDYVDGSRPTIIVMAYYACPMLCTFVLNGMLDGMKELAWNAGDQYRVLTVSIDPKDSVGVAAAKRDAYVKAYGRPLPDAGWDFLVGEEANVKRLADTLGFGYRWVPENNEYAHQAGAFFITPSGVLSRTLYGITFKGNDLRLALAEAGEGKLGGALERVLLFCFHYDPNARSYVLAASRVMKLGGLITLVLMGFFLLGLWKRERMTGPSPLAAPAVERAHEG